jgi:hypothetical protein
VAVVAAAPAFAVGAPGSAGAGTDVQLGHYRPGDVDLSGSVELADVIRLANYLFKEGEPPRPFYLLGDLDCTGCVDFLDLIRLVNYIFRNGSRCIWVGHYYLDQSGLTEARLMAMWYAKTLEPPDSLADRFQSDLARVRAEFTGCPSALNGIFFSPPWPLGEVRFLVDSATAHAIADSSYYAWDSLNQALALDSVTVSTWIEGLIYRFNLHFSSFMNPEVVAEAYRSLPGVLDAYAGIFVGEPPSSLWPHVQGDTATYLFKQGWDDCLAGCIYRRFWFVEVTPDTVRFIGTRPDGTGLEPAWWPRACENLVRSFCRHLCD